MDNLIKIENSSNMTGYYYEPLTHCLFLKFKGGTLYSYDLVPKSLVDEFEAAKSKGSFFVRHIKDKFKCTKFTAENPVNEKSDFNENNVEKDIDD